MKPDKSLLKDIYLQLLNDKCNLAIIKIENAIDRTLSDEEMRIAKAAFAIGVNCEAIRWKRLSRQANFGARAVNAHFPMKDTANPLVAGRWRFLIAWPARKETDAYQQKSRQRIRSCLRQIKQT